MQKKEQSLNPTFKIILSVFIAVILVFVLGYIYFMGNHYFIEVPSQKIIDRAIANNNLSICRELRNDWGYELCKEAFATNHLDLSMCDSLHYQRIKDSCYSSIAEHSLNISACNLISENSEKETCLSFISIETKNSTLCNSLTPDSIQREECFKWINN